MTAARPESAPQCPGWCTDHYGDPAEVHLPDADSYHSTGYVEVGAALINMTTGTTNRDVRVFGVEEAGGCHDQSLSLEDAERLALVLLGMVQVARRAA